MYLKISIENFVTIGLMLVVWMLILHTLGQFGVHFASWLPGGSS